MARITNKQSIAFSVAGKTASGEPANLTGLVAKSSDETIATVTGSVSADGFTFNGSATGVGLGAAQIMIDDPQSDGTDPTASGALEVVAEGVASLELAFGAVSQTAPAA